MKYWQLSILALFLLLSCSEDSESLNGNDSSGDETDIVVDLTDDELLDLTQKETFNYFWDFAEDNSGAARERYLPSDATLDENTVTTGGSGFGLMVIIAAVERGFITADEGFSRIVQILSFFETADRFHGAWPHWLNGRTGEVIPFSEMDNGGDLVETSYLAQALIVVSEYYKNGSSEQKELANKADSLWRGIEWNWYTQGENVLYWHWSPDYNWDIGLKIKGYNECLITYVLAAASPTYPISKEVYTNGWASSGSIVSSNTKYDYHLIVKHVEAEEYGGPLFWSHYSFLGLNPNGLVDEYVNYGDVVTNHAEINYSYCVENPLGYRDYGVSCWGLTASYSRDDDGGLTYAAHRPGNDLGVIAPTAALSSMPYTPEKSLAALRYFYYLKDKLLGPAGFYDAFSPQHNYWVAEAYLAIDQGPIVVMIENYRTQLFWNLFMQNENVQSGLTGLGFTFKKN
ncbi:MAG TPA: glucoamylase family protein [Prolixibacteraceae bacterium]|nr:glucoamylase family protein [Prolixibacteraceae bacterium]